MANLNRTDLTSDVNNNIYTNQQRRIKGNTLRDRLLNFIDSMLNKTSDKNQNGGYLGIDNGIVDINFIKSNAPQGYYLRDDGTWQPAVGGGGISGTGALNRIAVFTGATSIGSGPLQSAVELNANKGVANGYAGLDVNGKVPTAQLPDSILGATKFKGTWDANTNTITSSDITILGAPIPAASSSNEGWYLIVSVDGSSTIDGISDWKLGDWIISIGTAWRKIDNTDAVVSVNGMTGAVTLTKTHVGLGNVDDVQQLPITGGDLTGTAGAGFHGFIPQASDPATPGSGFRFFADSLGRLAWKGTNGFRRVFDALGITADRVYTLPDKSMTVAGKDDILIPITMSFGSQALADSTTYYFSDLPDHTPGVSVNARLYKRIPVTGTIVYYTAVAFSGGATSAEDCTLGIRLTSTNHALTSTLRFNNTSNGERSGDVSIACTKDETYQGYLTTPALATNGSASRIHVTLYIRPAN